MINNINKIVSDIISCRECSRLVSFREEIATKKRKSYEEWEYWGKPVPGFGDINSKLLILGLAPAAHGGNRTGRVFTGDKSADFLFKCLYQAGISNNSFSKNLNDNLKLKSTYITNFLKCVPPEDKPLSAELSNCSNYFDEEILSLNQLKVIVTLGKVAFDNCIKIFKNKFEINQKFSFKHGSIQYLSGKIIIIPSYHPSPRNVNTKLLSEKMMVSLLVNAKKLARI